MEEYKRGRGALLYIFLYNATHGIFFYVPLHIENWSERRREVNISLLFSYRVLKDSEQKKIKKLYPKLERFANHEKKIKK